MLIVGNLRAPLAQPSNRSPSFIRHHDRRDHDHRRSEGDDSGVLLRTRLGPVPQQQGPRHRDRHRRVGASRTDALQDPRTDRGDDVRTQARGRRRRALGHPVFRGPLRPDERDRSQPIPGEEARQERREVPRIRRPGLQQEVRRVPRAPGGALLPRVIRRTTACSPCRSGTHGSRGRRRGPSPARPSLPSLSHPACTSSCTLWRSISRTWTRRT